MQIYLDNNATTPVDPEVLDEMLPYLKDAFGNPSSIHHYGQRAKHGMDVARERVARLIGASPEEVVFTSGGTEADNFAIKGIFEAQRKRDQHIITSAIEHSAVLQACHSLRTRGASITYVGVDKNGVVNEQELVSSINENTSLISVMLANNDVGSIQPVASIAREAQKRGVITHTDAVQAAGKIPVDASHLGTNLISLSSHKIYGPKGAGALYIRRGTRIAPFVHGGHHEGRRRGGTENVPAIVGFGKACDLARARFEEDSKRITDLRDFLQAEILAHIPHAHVNAGDTARLPGTLSISFENAEGDAIAMGLDVRGIAVSTGAACSSESRDPSPVLTAMGVPPRLALGTIRFSIGRTTKREELAETVAALTQIVSRLRS